VPLRRLAGTVEPDQPAQGLVAQGDEFHILGEGLIVVGRDEAAGLVEGPATLCTLGDDFCRALTMQEHRGQHCDVELADLRQVVDVRVDARRL
jgi:hypothetical protein